MNKGHVALHVRLGDYLHKFPHKHPPVTVEYVTEAISHFPHHQPVVFSDDLNWCVQNLGHLPVQFCDEPDTLKAFELMQNMEHQIIANSTFSWLAAWFNRNEEKIVIAPKVWFGHGNRNIKSEHIVDRNIVSRGCRSIPIVESLIAVSVTCDNV